MGRHKPIGFDDSVQILASGVTPGVLQPGESNRVPVTYVGLGQPWDFRDSSVQFDLGVLTSDNDAVVDWDSLKEELRPDNIGVEAWEPIWANFVAAVGPSWGDYVTMLAENAAYLGRLGIKVTDVAELVAFEFAQADGLNPIGALATARDIKVEQPGIDLVFGRVFQQEISQRFERGALGYGWSHNWDYVLSESAEGNINLIVS